MWNVRWCSRDETQATTKVEAGQELTPRFTNDLLSEEERKVIMITAAPKNYCFRRGNWDIAPSTQNYTTIITNVLYFYYILFIFIFPFYTFVSDSSIDKSWKQSLITSETTRKMRRHAASDLIPKNVELVLHETSLMRFGFASPSCVETWPKWPSPIFQNMLGQDISWRWNEIWNYNWRNQYILSLVAG